MQAMPRVCSGRGIYWLMAKGGDQASQHASHTDTNLPLATLRVSHKNTSG